MAKPTVGPWEFVIHDDGDVSGVEFEIRMGTRLGGRNGWEPQHQIMFSAPSAEESESQYEEAKANARLIAAAPEMLAALQGLLAPEPGGVYATSDVIAAARAAVRKAEPLAAPAPRRTRGKSNG